jgi:N6-adenosine-specific RNA methylase IME4
MLSPSSRWPFGSLRPRAYRVINIDPPWPFAAWSKKGMGRSPENHYDTMPLADIAALPVGKLARDNANLFLHITGPILVTGAHLPILKAWGFYPSAMGFVWAKTKGDPAHPVPDDGSEDEFFTGMGFGTRQNCEFVVHARRGSVPRLSAKVRQLVLARRREHSRKPDEIYRRIEALYEGPYVDLFSRESRRGWDNWGHQATKFDGGK